MTFFSVVGKIVYKTRWKVSFAREIFALGWRLTFHFRYTTINVPASSLRTSYDHTYYFDKYFC
jgi:hypothetical protein